MSLILTISSLGGQTEEASEAERAAAPTLPGAERVQRPREAHDAHLQTAQCQDTERRQAFIFTSKLLMIFIEYLKRLTFVCYPDSKSTNRVTEQLGQNLPLT